MMNSDNASVSHNITYKQRDNTRGAHEKKGTDMLDIKKVKSPTSSFRTAIRNAIAIIMTLMIATLGLSSFTLSNAYAANENNDSGIALLANNVVDSSNIIDNNDYNIQLDLFDYWMTSRNAKDTVGSSGINANVPLQFAASQDTNIMESNKWTDTDGGPFLGMLERTLDSNGYPVLDADQIKVQSLKSQNKLDYLFDDSERDGKIKFSNANGLFQITNDNYIYYDCRKNYAYYDENNGEFILYDEPRISNGGTFWSGTVGEFFPFTTYEDTKYWYGGNVAGTEVSNHFFGLHMQTELLQVNGGVNKNTNEDVVYNFSGDDDVWLFIDGTLVGDLGGIHDTYSMQINFRTGDVLIYTDSNNDNTYENGEHIWEQTTILKQYELAGTSGTTNFSGNTFADNTVHKVDMFYLERGAGDSNMMMRFNFVQPHLKATKTVNTEQLDNAVAGESTLKYDFTITNESSVPVDDVSIESDSLLEDIGAPMSDITFIWPDPDKPGHLEPYETATGTYVYTIRQSDIEAGYVTNTAHAIAYVNGTKLDQDAPDPSVTTKITATPGLSLTKTADPDGMSKDETQVGAKINYEFVLKNTGNIMLSDIKINDALVSNSVAIDWATSSSDATSAGTLAPGETVKATASYSITNNDIVQGRVDNTATANAETSNGGVVTSNEATARTTLSVDSAIKLVKTIRNHSAGDPVLNASAGDTVSYDFVVTNVGNTDLYNVKIDDKIDDGDNVVFDWDTSTDSSTGEGVLSRNESVNAHFDYKLKQSDIDNGFLVNFATAYGNITPEADSYAVTDDDSVSINISRTPSLKLVKTVDDNTLEGNEAVSGHELSYDITVTNDGNVTISAPFDVEGSMIGVDGFSWSWKDGKEPESLAPGESAVIEATYSVDQDNIDAAETLTNTATVKGSDPDGKTINTDDNDDSMPTVTTDIAPTSSISLVKTAVASLTPEESIIGHEIQYDFVITNTGNTTLSDVSLRDPLIAGSTLPATIDWSTSTNADTADGTLAPGESVSGSGSHFLTQFDINNGYVENEAIVSGKWNGTLYEANDTVRTEVHGNTKVTIAEAGSQGASIIGVLIASFGIAMYAAGVERKSRRKTGEHSTVEHGDLSE